MTAPTFSTPAAAPQRGSDTFSSEVATFLSYISTLGNTELPTFVTWLQQQIALTEAAKGAGLWVTGTAYTTGAYAVSPSDLQLYKATSDMGSSTTDPASDAANWEIVVVAVSAGGTGAGTAAGAQVALGLEIGVDVLAYSAILAAIVAGDLDDVDIGQTTPGAGAFTTLAADNLVGMVASFAMATPPTGWLKANGATVSRTTYADLFAAIGTTYGAGDGATTFDLPDFRGEFIRGLDDARGVDSGRAIGSAQGFALQEHNHKLASYSGGTTAGYPGFGWGNPGAVFYQVNGTTGGAGTGKGVMEVQSATTAAETRPRNIAALICIKY